MEGGYEQSILISIEAPTPCASVGKRRRRAKGRMACGPTMLEILYGKLLALQRKPLPVLKLYQALFNGGMLR